MKKTKYRLIGGSHTIRGHRYEARDKDNNVLELYPHEAEWIMNRLERLDGKTAAEAVKAEVEEKETPVVCLKAVHRGRGKWDVINEVTGEAINDEHLNKDEAKELVNAEQMEGSEDLEKPDSDLIRRGSILD